MYVIYVCMFCYQKYVCSVDTTLMVAESENGAESFSIRCWTLRFAFLDWKLRWCEQMRTRRNVWFNLTDMVAPQEIERAPPEITGPFSPFSFLIYFFFSIITDFIEQHNRINDHKLQYNSQEQFLGVGYPQRR